MDNKHKGNLAIASAIKQFVSVGYMVSLSLSDTAKYDSVVERVCYPFPKDSGANYHQCWPRKQVVKVGAYYVPDTGGDCSATEESVDENSSNSAKPFGMATPSQAPVGEGVET